MKAMTLQPDRKGERMNKLATQLGAVVVLAAVLALFVMPAFDVQPTALRASRAAQQLLIAFSLMAAMAALLSPLSLQLLRIELLSNRSEVPHPDLIDIICSRLC